MNRASLVGPVVLIAVGVLFLINNFGFHLSIGHFVREFWPGLLILIGALKIAEAGVSGPAKMHGNMTAGVLLVVIGGLFMLQNIVGIGLGRTWPVILIAVGVLSFLRFSGGYAAGGRGGWTGGRGGWK